MENTLSSILSKTIFNFVIFIHIIIHCFKSYSPDIGLSSWGACSTQLRVIAELFWLTFSSCIAPAQVLRSVYVINAQQTFILNLQQEAAYLTTETYGMGKQYTSYLKVYVYWKLIKKGIQII